MGNNMRLDDEILRAVRHQAASDTETRKTPEEIDNISKKVKEALENKTYNFSNSKSIVLKQNGKKRFVKQFPDIYSAESVLCQYIKNILDRTFKVKYPNRNKSVRMLFDVITAIKQMSDFTIFKFDFKDYFNSVSTMYVFEKFLKAKLTDRPEIALIENFAKNTRYAYAGFSTSNVIAEIIAKQFDDAVKQALSTKGVLFYERYIDDSIIVFNEHIEEPECLEILQQALKVIFFDDAVFALPKCKTRLNPNKFCYISKRTLVSAPIPIDYLGYEFRFSCDREGKTLVKYGITNAKRKKYNERIDKLISYYSDVNHPDFGNLELLRHRIAAFTSRTVYRNKRFRSDIWKAKGFILNYGELRYLLNTSLIEADTEKFLKDMVNDACVRAGIPLPYFIAGPRADNGYNLFENMKKNKTLMFVNHIGYDYRALVKLCKKIGIDDTDKKGVKRGYGTLVRDYLIETKVGY
jgi:hypothetical protein